jgi:hypothetical protein
MLDILSRETDHERSVWKSCWKLTDNGINDGSAKIAMTLQTQRNGKVKIPKANAWRILSNTTASRETADHSRPSKSLVLKKKKGK